MSYFSKSGLHRPQNILAEGSSKETSVLERILEQAMLFPNISHISGCPYSAHCESLGTHYHEFASGVI